MENFSEFDTKDDPIELPPGFRFHPTDEELITHYLSHKVQDNTFCTKAIGEVDLNRVEPWDLPWKAKMGENEWYFFCVRDRKYPTGSRTNRATGAGYWKATGKDREIFRACKFLVGMKKTLVFYKGRAPRGEKTNWVMHEYRLEGKHSFNNKNEWVICRIFEKGSGGKIGHNVSGLVRTENCGDDDDDDDILTSDLPPLMDLSCNGNHTAAAAFASERLSRVTCFSNSEVSPRGASLEDPTTWRSCVHSPLPPIFPKDSNPNSVSSFQVTPPGVVGFSHTKQNDAAGFSDYMNIQEVGFMPCEEHGFTSNLYGSVDLDYLWN